MQNNSSNKAPRALVAASVGLIGLSSSVGAQELFGSFSDYSQASGYELQDEALAQSDSFEMLKYGVRSSVTFDDNVFLSDGNEDSDVIFSTDLILSLKNDESAANSWVLSYVPSYKLYSDNSQLDGLDHNLNAGFSKVLPKTQIDLSVDFADISGSNRYAAGQIDKTTYGAKLAVSHLLTGKTRTDLDLGFRSDDYDGSLVGRDRFNARLAWLYQWSGKVNVGPYLGYESTNVDGGGDHEAVSFGATFEYQALAKTSLNGYIGGENRSFDTAGTSDRTAWTYNLGARHQLTAKTGFNAAVFRRVAPSYNAGNSSYTATGFYLGGDYAVSDKLKLRSRLNFEQDDYFGGNSVSALDNDYFSISVGGSYVMPCGLNLGADLTFREKDSKGSGDFDNTLFQVDASYFF